MSLEYFPYLERVLERMNWSSKEVVRELGGRPTLTVRVHVEGPTFPLRALEPIMRIGKLQADHVEVDPDGRWARGYFTKIPDGDHLIEFGFDDGIMFRFPKSFQASAVERLDRRRLAQDVTSPFEWGPR